MARLQKNYVQPNNKQLKELNIIKKKNSFTYISYQNIENKTQKLNLKVKKYFVGVNRHNILLPIKRKNSPFTAIAMTDISILRINYLMQYSDTVPYSKQNEIASKYFRENVNKLIPIKVDSTYVIWFEPTEKLTEIISKHKLKIVRQDIEKRRSTNLLNFNEFELQKLGISFEKGAIKMPIISQKNNTAFISLRKRNSSTTFIFDTLNNKNTGDKTVYAVPILVTDKSGLNWRFYQLDTSFKVGRFSEYEISTTKKLNTCIPIKISHKNVELIAWYEPNSLFLSSLPSVQSIEIENDLMCL